MKGRISDLAQRAAHRFGDATAIAMLGGETLSFREVDARAARFAGGLAARGIRPGDRVVLYLANSPEWLIAYHAIARMGAVVVPANILLSPAEVAYLVGDAEAAAVIVAAEHKDNVTAALGTDAPPLIWAVGARDGDDGFQALLAGPALDPLDVDPEALVALCYTSGTTGRPKGAMLTHANIFSSTALTATIHARTRGESVLTALPLPHVYGNIIANAAFLVGMRLVLMPRFDAGEALSAISSTRPDLFEGVPTMYYQMLAHPDAGTTDFSSLSRCTVGGQAMPIARIDEVVARFGCALCELWGMTEVAGPAASHSPYWPPRHGTIGLPFPSVELRIADLDDRSRTMPDGESGELCIRGPLVTSGYWRDPEKTAQVLDTGGWFATGDVGVREPDGYVRILDRRNDMIITGGFNIYPAELEQVLAMHPAVAMSAVAPIPDDEKGELAKAYIVLRPGARCDLADLEAHCRRHLARYKIPRLFAFVDDLPKTSTGKITRRALRAAEAPSRHNHSG